MTLTIELLPLPTCSGAFDAAFETQFGARHRRSPPPCRLSQPRVWLARRDIREVTGSVECRRASPLVHFYVSKLVWPPFVLATILAGSYDYVLGQAFLW